MMSVLTDETILQAIELVCGWDLPPAALSHAIKAEASALAGRWPEDGDLPAAIHASLHA
jgi:hypothetical protein